MKHFIVSDIHSYYVELKTALQAAGFEKRNKNHCLIICGDLFDRGPDAIEVYKFINSLPKKRCILVKGNHELLYEELLTKSYPEQHDFSNGTVDTFVQIANSTLEISRYSAENFYKKIEAEQNCARYSDEDELEILKLQWKKVLAIVKEHAVTKLVTDKNRWLNYYGVDKFIFVHSFIPLKVLDCLPMHYVNNRKFEYFKDWRIDSTEEEIKTSMWGCPYKNYDAGYFDEEEKAGKILVCGHWCTDDFMQYFNPLYSGCKPYTKIFMIGNIIGLDGGVWRYKGTSKEFHPQNVLVISDDYKICYDESIGLNFEM